MFVCPECGRSEGRAGTCTTDGTELQPTSDPLLGTEISRYRLARTLGEGGMGRVYLAVQPAIGSRVAIKVLSEECTRSPELLERFFAEAKAVNLIRHENIISVLDLATLPDGRPFIIMEFIEGHTLSHYVRNTHAPLGGVAQVVGEVLSGLAAAHAIGIVHRDLKPDNVLVTGEGHAKVLDFGIAKLAPGLRADVSPRTKTGALLGTPAYMAPEQISGAQNVDARTDIYAAGVVLYEAVTGSAPFAGATLFDIMRAHLELEPQRPRERRADIPPALEDVILQALAKDPAHRFQSAAAMSQALQHATATLPADQWRPLSTRGGARISASGIGHRTTERDSMPPPMQRSVAVAPATQAPRRRAGLVIGVLAAAAIATGVLLLALSGGDDNTPGVAAPEVAATAQLETPPSPSPSPAPAPTPAPAPAQTPSPAPTKAAAPAPAKPAQPRPSPAKPASAEPTVSIGPNVTTGPGVVIGTSPTVSSTALPRTTIAKPADYDPRRFDPVAYLPKALALARQLLPDAKLTSFEFDPVYPDGHVDLTKDGRDREYLFRSPSKSARPADVPRNMPVERACMVYVEVGTREITATIRKSEDCDAKLVRHPTCRFAGVWKQAIKNGTPTDVVARVGWLFDEQWFFDVDLEGKGGGVSSFPDRCP